MKAVTYQGIKNVQVRQVQDPKLQKADDIIVKLTTTAICGSDLHLIHGMIPNLPTDYIIGHEPMGIVEEVGPGDIITHVLPLDQAKHGYEVFDTKTDGCIKVVLKP